MKRIHKKRHYARRYPKITALSSILLLFSCAAAILTIVVIGHALLYTDTRVEKTAEIATQEVFAQKTYRQITANMQRIEDAKSLRKEAPTILIYHTHTTEAYFQTEQRPYQETSKWRTNDPTNNVTEVGEVLKDILERQYGFHVIHDVTNHEPPKLSSSYDRSLITMQKYHELYPSICLFIDLHRDAYQDTDSPQDYLVINGVETARMMFVVGKGEKYTDKPFFETNEALAQRLTNYLKTIDPKLARPIRIKSGRYNQHVAPNCLLVEVGHNANTIDQAIAAMSYLADSIAYAYTCDSCQTLWVPN